MKKFLVINYPGHGHVNPTIKMMKDLICLGNEVVCYCTEEFRGIVEKTGARFKSYNYEPLEEDDDKIDEHLPIENAIRLTDAMLSIILKEKEEFDVIIYDSVLSIGEDIAQRLNIKKTVALYTTFAISKNMVSLVKKSGKRTFLVNGDSDEFKGRTREINEKYDIKLRSMIDNVSDCKAQKKLVFASEYYQPFIEDFDQSFLFLGPSIIERGEEIKFDFEKEEGKTLIYISQGTKDTKKIEFYQTTFRAFGDLEKIEVILSVGKKTDIESLGKIPSNFKVYNYVPQLEVLKKADIFITHGGMNSCSEGLYHNIPLIVLPQFGDQILVSKIVKNSGAGIMIHRVDVTELTLREAVGEIIANPSYKNNATLIGESLRNASKEANQIYKDL